jgi:transposase InsO family protein
VKYAFIARHRRVWPITVQCRVLEVSVSGYHGHLVRRSSTRPCRHLSDAALLVHIRAIHARTRGGYGWPRIWRELRGQDLRVGKQRVQKLMQQHGIRAKGKRRFKVTTDSAHDQRRSSHTSPSELTSSHSWRTCARGDGSVHEEGATLSAE